MKDVQVTFLRQTAKLESLDFITTIIERGYPNASSVQTVEVNGSVVGFGLLDVTTINYALPPGVTLESVSSITYHVATPDGVGGTEIVLDSRPLPEPTFLSSPYLVEDLKIFYETSSIVIKTAETAEVVEVLLNGGSVPYFVLDPTHVVAALPDSLKELLSVDVIVGASSQTERTFYTHAVDLSKTLEGPQKLIAQFNKLLLTTSGSDIFEKGIGGNFQNWVGMKHSLANKTSAIITANINILRTATFMQLKQMSNAVPRKETIATAQVLDYSVDYNDPTQGEVSLSVVTMAGLTQIFNTQIEKAKSLAAEAVSNVESATGVDLSAKSDLS